MKALVGFFCLFVFVFDKSGLHYLKAPTSHTWIIILSGEEMAFNRTRMHLELTLLF